MEQKTRKKSEFLTFLSKLILILILISIIIFAIYQALDKMNINKRQEKKKQESQSQQLEYNNNDILFKMRNDKYVNLYGYVKYNSSNTEGIYLQGISENISQIDYSLFNNLKQLYEIINNNDLIDKVSKIDISNIDNIKIYVNSENKIIEFGAFENLSTKITYAKYILEQEQGKNGTIFVNDTSNVYFKEGI